MKIRIAFLDEPPFYWTDKDSNVVGADIELAQAVLRALGATTIEYVHVAFGELLSGVAEGRWDMNVPIFITPERAKSVAFSRPVWALVDGFVVHAGNPKALTGYEAVAARGDARLGVIAGQVQIESARTSGVTAAQMTVFKDQPEAVAALIEGKIDAFAGTAVGNRTVAAATKGLESVAHSVGNGSVPVGGFSFSKKNSSLLNAVNEQLRIYLGSPDHRARAAKYGLTRSEIDSVVG